MQSDWTADIIVSDGADVAWEIDVVEFAAHWKGGIIRDWFGSPRAIPDDRVCDVACRLPNLTALIEQRHCAPS